jgi:hypothetical protein
MASWEQIEREIRSRNAKIRLFLRYAHRAGIRPFYGNDRYRKDGRGTILVSPDLQKKGIWRVTWFVDDEPGGHSTFRSFDEAVADAVKEFGLDLDTVHFIADRDAPSRSGRPRTTRGILPRHARARRP